MLVDPKRFKAEVITELKVKAVRMEVGERAFYFPLYSLLDFFDDS